MPSYILRNLDDDFWAKFKKRAEKDGHPLRWVIVSLIEFYVRHGMPQKPEK